MLPNVLSVDLSGSKQILLCKKLCSIEFSYFSTPSSIVLLFYQFSRRFPCNFSWGKWTFHHYFLFSTKTTFRDFLAFFLSCCSSHFTSRSSPRDGQTLMLLHPSIVCQKNCFWIAVVTRRNRLKNNFTVFENVLI